MERSSYRSYAYGKPVTKWLNTEVILSRFLNVADRHLAYRESAQKYAKEQHRIWQNLQHGLFLGTKKFVDSIKERYLPQPPHVEIPGQMQISKSMDADKVLSQATALLNCDLDRMRSCARVSDADKTKRDLLIYLLWQSGQLSNHQIGERFGLTYSAVSRRVGIFKDFLRENSGLQNKLSRIKSLIKI